MASNLKPKHQRLVLFSIALVAIVGAGVLAAWGLKNQASYYYVPSEMLEFMPSPDQPGRIGGMVQEGSLTTAADGVTVNFLVTDGKATFPVRYTGLLPDLFVEGSGVVADGHVTPDGVFVAETMLARHDENYVPRELAEMTPDEVREVMVETTE